MTLSNPVPEIPIESDGATELAWEYHDRIMALRKRLADKLAPGYRECAPVIERILVLEDQLEAETRPLYAPGLPGMLRKALEHFRGVQDRLGAILDELDPAEPDPEEDGDEESAGDSES
jgi:hypothetical protein